jgi:hypothetical protein
MATWEIGDGGKIKMMPEAGMNLEPGSNPARQILPSIQLACHCRKGDRRSYRPKVKRNVFLRIKYTHVSYNE